jgi:hypothetical protein
MIDYIISTDSTIIEASAHGGSGAYISGAVYWDSNSRQFKVIDGNGNPQTLSGGTANISVGTKLREMIAWFEQKQFEEKQLAELCKQYPNLAEAKREFDSIYNLVKEHK